MNYYKNKYYKYKSKYLAVKHALMQRGGNENDGLVKLEGVTPDLYIPRDVAIVGNSPALLERDHTMIDKHACVIRVNSNGLNNDFYKSRAGVKCDIFLMTVFRNESLISLLQPQYKNSKIIRMPDFHYYSHLIKKKDGLSPLEKIDKNLIYDIDTKSKYYCFGRAKACLSKVNIDDDITGNIYNPNISVHCTTGLLTVLLCLVSGIKPTLYGFTRVFDKDKYRSIADVFVNETNIKKEQYKNLEQSTKINFNVSHHDFQSEARIINKLFENGLINFIE